MKINRTWVKVISRIIFVVYIILLSYFLFFSERYGRTTSLEEYRYNLTLFKELKRFIKYRRDIGIESFIVNIFGNILAFTPFGFVIPIISKENRKLFHIVFLSLEFSLIIELLQLIFRVGIFDIDDIFLNTLGGFIGGIAFFICYAIFKVRGGSYEEEKRNI